MRSLSFPRQRDLAPFVGAAAMLASALAMQARLMPLRHIAIQFPPSIDDAAGVGALPQFSLPPDAAAERAVVDTTVLPREAVPDQQTAPTAGPSVATAPPEDAAPWGADQAVAPPGGAISTPLGIVGAMGAGNLHLRLHSGPSSPLSALATDLKAQIERLHPLPQVRAKRSAASATAVPKVKLAGRMVAEEAKPGPSAAVPGIAGPMRTQGALGGLSPLTVKETPILDGTSFKRR